MSGYGAWTKHQDDDAPATQDTPDATESATPATDQAQGGFGWGALITLFLGFAPGLQLLWVASAVCLVIWLVSPAVGKLEASANHEAKTNGGGGCDVVLAGLILLVLAVGAVLAMAAAAGGGL